METSLHQERKENKQRPSEFVPLTWTAGCWWYNACNKIYWRRRRGVAPRRIVSPWPAWRRSGDRRRLVKERQPRPRKSSSPSSHSTRRRPCRCLSLSDYPLSSSSSSSPRNESPGITPRQSSLASGTTIPSSLLAASPPGIDAAHTRPPSSPLISRGYRDSQPRSKDPPVWGSTASQSNSNLLEISKGDRVSILSQTINQGINRKFPSILFY